MSTNNTNDATNHTVDNDSKMTFSYKLGNSEAIYGAFENKFDGYQNYLPIYDKFFVLNDENYNKVTLNSNYTIKNLDNSFNFFINFNFE